MKNRSFREKYIDHIVETHKSIKSSYVIEYFGTEYLVMQDVFSPILTASTTAVMRVMMDNQNIFENAIVLDMGTGVGCLAAQSVELGADHSLAVDLNKSAVQNTRVNASRLNISDKIDAVQSDLFEKIPRQKFDVILANLPFSDGKANTHLEGAFFDEDFDTRQSFLNRTSDYVHDESTIYITSSSESNNSLIFHACLEKDLEVSKVYTFTEYVLDIYVFVITVTN